MTKLIKNELTKIFHKKSIYIMLFIMLFFSIVGVISSYVFSEEMISSLENYTYDYEVKALESELKTYDLTKEVDRNNYIIVKAELLTAKDRMQFKESYKKNYVDEYAADYIHCEVENEVNGKKEEAEECKKNHIEIIEEIKNNDWKHFVENQLSKINKNIADAEAIGATEMLEDLKTNKKALEYQLKYNISPSDSKINIIDSYKSYKNTYEALKSKEKILNDEEKATYKTAKANYKISEYKLENNILYDDYGTLMSLDNTFKSTGFFVIITIALIAGSIVSDEFNKGTIKQLLIRPYSRSKILLSKLLTAFIVFLIVLACHYLLNVLMGVLSGNAGEILMPILRYNYTADTIYKESLIVSLILGTLKILPCYIMILTFAFLASTVTKNDALGILAGIGLYFGGNILNAILTLRKLWINKLVPTLCWDLDSYLSSYQSLDNIILPIIVDVITVAIIVVIAFIVFKKTDIKNQ